MSSLTFLSDASSIFIFWLFAVAGSHKLNPNNDGYFSDLLEEYGIKNSSVALSIAKAIGTVEIIIGVAIIVPYTRSISAVFAMAILFTYLLVMAKQYFEGKRDLDCGCSGPGSELKIGPAVLIRNSLLLIVAASCFNNSHGLFSEYWAFSILLSLSGILVYLCSEQIMKNLQHLKLMRQN